MKKNGKVETRMIVFLVIVVIIIVATISIIVLNINRNKIENKGELDNKVELEAQVNPDAVPESNPSIGGIDNVKAEGNLKVNTSDKLKENKTFGIYTLSNITMVKGEDGTTITANLTADVTEKTAGKDAVMKFYNKNGELLSQMGTYIPQVKPGETSMFSTATTSDVANAYDFTIEF